MKFKILIYIYTKKIIIIIVKFNFIIKYLQYHHKNYRLVHYMDLFYL